MIIKAEKGRFVFYALLYLGILIMMVTISQYVTLNRTVGFLQFKQGIVANKFWLSVFYVHVFTCFVCLFAGLTQFSKWVLLHHPKFHRIIGKVYAYNIVFINFPIGLVLAFFANGGLSGKLAFTILDVLWLYFTASAVKSIIRGDLKRHQENMIRSFALTLSALTLRAWKIVFIHLTTIDNSTIYIIDAWLGFSLNLVIAEIIIYRRKKLSLQPDIAGNQV